MRGLPLALLPALALGVLMLAVQVADLDVWGRLSVGAVLFEAGHLPRVDDFSFTAAGAPWVDHEWLTGVVFYALLLAGGEPLLVATKYALAAAALACVIAIARVQGARCAPVVVGYGLTLAAPVLLLGYLSTLRAQLFSFLAFGLCLLALERVRLGRADARSLGWLVLLAVVWGNLHGGVAMGLLAVALYAAAALWENGRNGLRAALPYAATLLGMAAALCLANPYGPAYASFLLHAWTLDRAAIAEWQPLLSAAPKPDEWFAAAFAGAAAAVAVRDGARALRAGPGRRGADASPAFALAPALVLALLVAMSLTAARIRTFLALSLVAFLPLALQSAGAGSWLARVAERAERAGTFGRVVVPSLLCAVALAALVWVGFARPPLAAPIPQLRAQHPVAYPVGVVRFLRHSPYAGNLLNPFNHGQYLYWALYPRFRVALDGRYEEVYAQAQLHANRDFYDPRAAPGRAARQLAFAAEIGADFALFPSGWPTIGVLTGSGDWQLVHDDGDFALVAHRRALEGRPAYEARGRPAARLSLRNYFTPADRARFANYPR